MRPLRPRAYRPRRRQIPHADARLPALSLSAYDMAAICFRGWDCETNFPAECYRDDAVLAWHMQHDTTEAYVQVRVRSLVRRVSNTCACSHARVRAFVQWLRRGGKEPHTLGSLPTAGSSGELTAVTAATALSPAEDGVKPSSAPAHPAKIARSCSRTSPSSPLASTPATPGGSASSAIDTAAAASMSSFASGILPSVAIREAGTGTPPPELLRAATAPLFGDLLATPLATLGVPTHTAAGVPIATLVGAGVPTGDATSGSDTAAAAVADGDASAAPAVAEAQAQAEAAAVADQDFFSFARDLVLSAPGAE